MTLKKTLWKIDAEINDGKRRQIYKFGVISLAGMTLIWNPWSIKEIKDKKPPSNQIEFVNLAIGTSGVK